ncbi:unnamed protein product, partial [Rotaria magnacalcarata]
MVERLTQQRASRSIYTM